jgi:acyl carrier protein
MTSDEIYHKVEQVLVEVLNVDEEEISLDSIIQGDLGAESIDLLDIKFRLERKFGIKIPREEFSLPFLPDDPEYVCNHMVTQKGLDELRHQLPFADLSSFEKNPEIYNISDLFTVGMICRYLENRLMQDGDGAPRIIRIRQDDQS